MRLQAPQLPQANPPITSYHPPDYRATWNRERYGNLTADSLSLSISLIVLGSTEGLPVLLALLESTQSGVNTLSDLLGADESMRDVHEVTKVLSIPGMLGGLIFEQFHIKGGFELGYAVGQMLGDVPKVGKTFTLGPSHFIHDGPAWERIDRWAGVSELVHDLADAKEEHDKAESNKASEEREAAPLNQPQSSPAPAPAPIKQDSPTPPAPQGQIDIHQVSNGNDVHSGARGGGPIFDGGGGGGKYGGTA